ncbi:nicalin-1 [Teleopsis dalmanni]|uniref:nicalin-1 n=1 Tax=Teleopsis dalmanni TaxID=139649 RepID=UPI0018CF9A6F|nr:nicalin-1 [Teleopsis dalmanni]
MFEEADNFADIFRGGLPYYLLFALPILIICSSNPVIASSEFAVQRMSQYDINGVSYGCRSSAISLEAKSIYTWSTARHCVVARLQELSIDQFNEIRQKAGGLIILLPKNYTSLSFEEKQYITMLEQAMLSQPNSIPIYFSEYNENLDKIMSDIYHSTSVNNSFNANKNINKRDSAISEIFSSISANGYQIVVTGATHVNNKNSKIPIIQGELAPNKNVKQVEGAVDPNTKLPLIVVAAHLKTFGLYNEYPVNADVAILMTIADLFSKMHNRHNSAPKYRLMFLLSESGPLLNFQGIKKWLDENVQLQNVDFVLCLDTIALPQSPKDATSIYMHVSKPPKEGTPVNNFYKLLKTLGTATNNITIEGVHKKINLADQYLAWEHERFSMKRLPAFTLSTLKSSKDPIRTTIFRDNDDEIIAQAQINAKIIAEALARHIYHIEEEEGEIFSGTTEINAKLVKSYFNVKSALHNDDLKNGFEKYLKNVKIIYDKPDVREPDFMFYEGQYAKLNIYRVKPAVFDLFLTIVICAYLLSVYLFIQNFPNIYDIVCKMTKVQAITNSNSNHTERLKSKQN